MINFELIEKIGPDDDEICNIYAIYGQAPVIDISIPSHQARIYDERDSAIDIVNEFGLVSDIKFFYEAESFDLTLDF